MTTQKEKEKEEVLSFHAKAFRKAQSLFAKRSTELSPNEAYLSSSSSF